MFSRSAALAILLALVPVLPSAAQSSGRFHLVRSTSGSRGTKDGNRFLIEDPRVVFHAGQDRQVLVMFEWQGPAGQHRCEGKWRDPSGRVVFTSDAVVDARGPRFGVYWGLSLPDAVTAGTWVLEAIVDGEAAGVHAFQVLADSSKPGGVPARRVLTIAELYQRGVAETLTLETLDPSSGHLGTTSGFFVAPDLVSTSFGGINAARVVRLITPDQRRLETSEVVSWNRRDDWAVLRFVGAGGRPIDRAQTGLEVGDRCFFLDAQGEGARVIVEATVVGRSPSGDLTLAEAAGEASNGAPVLNEYGQTTATLAGSGLLGATVLDLVGLADATRRIQPRGARARPLVPAPEGGATSRTLRELEETGAFVRPLVHTPHFVNGVLGTGVERQGPVPVAANQRSRFSRADGQCVVFVTWVPARKEDTTIRFEVYDEDGHQLAATDPKRARLRAGESFVQYWGINLAALKPGVYRVDVMAGADPVWRTFFRVTD